MKPNKKPPPLKKFRLLVNISLVITVLSLTLLLWTYRLESSWQSRTQYYQTTREPPIPKQPVVPPQCGPGLTVPQEQKVSLVTVNRTKSLLISAYREHRTGKDEIRVIAVVLRSKTVSYRCHLCCQEQLHFSEGVTKIQSNHFNFVYGTADIMCPIPEGCKTPSHIAVTSAASSDNINKTFLEVKNQEARNDSFPYNFTVCLSTMFDYTNVLQLVQSLEMMQLLGVNRVIIYRTSNSPETQRVLDYYTHKGLVEVLPWSFKRFLNVSRGWLPKQGPGDLHYMGQIPALTDCVYRSMYQSKYVAMQDIDELILPQSVNSWLELLPLLENQFGADRCYNFHSKVFPVHVKLPPPTSENLPPQNPDWQFVPGVNILDHLYHEPIRTNTVFSNSKYIVNPRAVFTLRVHGLVHSLHGCSWVDRSVARLYHTRAAKQTQLTPDQLVFDGRLLSYSAHLTRSVNTVLRESGLLLEDNAL